MGVPVLLMLFLVAMERLESRVLPRHARGGVRPDQPVRPPEPFARNG